MTFLQNTAECFIVPRYDQGEVTVARSLLVLDMAKAPAEEVSLKTLLQVWFSSCLDQQTKEELTAFIHKKR